MANTIQVERAHVFAVYRNTAPTDPVDAVRIERAHDFAVYQNSAPTDPVDRVRIERAHDFAVYQNSAPTDPVDRVRIERSHAFAVYRASPIFTIVGNELRVSNAMVGTWPVTIRTTDVNLDFYSETFNVVIHEGPSMIATGQSVTTSVGSVAVVTNVPVSGYAGTQVDTGGGGATWNVPNPYTIGPAAANRVVVACVSFTKSSAITITSVTIGGVAGTKIGATMQGGFGNAAMYYAVVPTGATASVTAVFSIIPNGGAGCSVYYCYPAITTPLDYFHGTSTGTAVLSNMESQAGGLVIGFRGGSNTAGGTDFAWTGADAFTEDYDAVVNIGSHAVGHVFPTSSSTISDLTCDPPGSAGVIFAAWGDAPASGYDALAMHFEGTDASTSMLDEGVHSHSITVFGNAQIDTAQFKSGGSSLLLDGTGDYLTAPNHSDWWVNDRDFSFEGWYRFNNNTALQCLFSLYNSSSQRAYAFYYRGDLTPDSLGMTTSPDGVAVANLLNTSSWTPTVGQWYHVVYDRSAHVHRIYVDGVMLGKITDAAAFHQSNTQLRIGGVFSTSETSHFNGHMDRIRFHRKSSLFGAVYGDAGFTSTIVDRVRLMNQYAEVITSGGASAVRLSNQYAEVITTGASNTVRLTDQYGEVVVPGTLDAYTGPAIKYSGLVTDSAGSTSYSVPNIPFGPLGSNRLIVIGIATGFSLNHSITSMTLGGVTMTLHPDSSVFVSSGVLMRLWMGVVDASTITSRTLVVNSTNPVGTLRISSWTLYGMNATPLDHAASASATSTTVDFPDVEVAAGGAVVYMSLCGTINTANTTTWTGTDAVVEDSENGTHSGNGTVSAGHILVTASSTTDDLTTTLAASATHVGLVWSFGP